MVLPTFIETLTHPTWPCVYHSTGSGTIPRHWGDSSRQILFTRHAWNCIKIALWHKKKTLYYCFSRISFYLFFLLPLTQTVPASSVLWHFWTCITLYTHHFLSTPHQLFQQLHEGEMKTIFFLKCKLIFFPLERGKKKKEPSSSRLCLPYSIFKQQPQKLTSGVYFNCINQIWINFIKPVSIQKYILSIFWSTFIYKRKNELRVSSQIKKTI